MKQSSGDRRQVVRDARGDRAAPLDHLPPGGDAQPPTDLPPDAAGDPGRVGEGQRTHGEAGDAVRPHNEGAEQGPR
ncbi:MAG TPA: hypothetical protein VFX65_07845 [Candidatus Limnocylindrales bacterium]|nr:hypothetical protein [Candidatus Limnocylindrales bacterium]